jgi:hypothetical protein
MLQVLKDQKSINAFILVLNGSDIRWDVGQLQMLDLLDQTFPMIWTNVIIVINHLHQDLKSINRREKDGRSDAQLKRTIKDNLRQRYHLNQEFALPAFFLDCKYDEDDEEESAAFKASFENILISAKIKTPYNPQSAIAAKPIHVKLEEEKKSLEQGKVSAEKKARENEERANKEA